MPNEQLVSYIRGEFAQGVDRTTIIRSLVTASWKMGDINAALANVDSASNPSTQSVPLPPMTPVQSTYSAPAMGVPSGMANVVPVIKYAGFWVRAGAMVVDGVILYIIGVALGLGGIDTFISTVIGLCFIIFMVTKYQASPGKIVAGLHIERVSGERIGVGRAILREIVGKFLSAIVLGIGYLMVAWTKKKQGLHDKVADTVVVENDPSKNDSPEKKIVWVVIGVFGVFLVLAALYALAVMGLMGGLF